MERREKDLMGVTWKWTVSSAPQNSPLPYYLTDNEQDSSVVV